MQNPYAVLGLTPDAGMAEIKRAYRKKAKKLHPDVSGSDAEQFRLLYAAYKALCDERANLFERAFTVRERRESFNYREWLLQRTDEESRCKLVFWDLMHGREEDAVELFKILNREISACKVASWFPREDFMDYGFILAEELSIRAEFYDAVLLLEQIIVMEQKRPYFKYFFPEVQALTRNILLHRIDGIIHAESAVALWERALDWGFGKKDEAAFLIKMADAYAKMHNKTLAAVCIAEAKRLNAGQRVPASLRQFM